MVKMAKNVCGNALESYQRVAAMGVLVTLLRKHMS